MTLPKERNYTFEDYWNLPEGVRSDLVAGQLYIRKTPLLIHAELVGGLSRLIGNYLCDHRSEYKLILGPFAVNPDQKKINWVEPDILINCDSSKVNEEYFCGAPDWIIEVTSFDSRLMDYNIKNSLYASAGVREYWIVDPEKKQTTVYHYEEDAAPTIYLFSQAVPVGILKGVLITISDLLDNKINTALLSEPSLAKDWLSPAEDRAWKTL